MKSECLGFQIWGDFTLGSLVLICFVNIFFIHFSGFKMSWETLPAALCWHSGQHICGASALDSLTWSNPEDFLPAFFLNAFFPLLSVSQWPGQPLVMLFLIFYLAWEGCSPFRVKRVPNPSFGKTFFPLKEQQLHLQLFISPLIL